MDAIKLTIDLNADKLCKDLSIKCFLPNIRLETGELSIIVPYRWSFGNTIGTKENTFINWALSFLDDNVEGLKKLCKTRCICINRKYSYRRFTKYSEEAIEKLKSHGFQIKDCFKSKEVIL